MKSAAGAGFLCIVDELPADLVRHVSHRPAEFPAGVKPVLTLSTRVATKNYAIDLSVPGVVSLSAVIVSYYAVNHQGPGGPALGTAILCAYAAALVAGVIKLTDRMTAR